MDERWRHRLQGLRWIATLVFLLVAVARTDLRAVASRMTHLDGRFVALFLALSVPLYALMAWRWHFTARRLGLDLPYRRAVAEYYVSTLLNQVMPFGIAGDVVRTARHRGRLAQEGAGWGPPARAVVLERVSGLIALSLLVAASALLWTMRGQRAFSGPLVACAALVVLFGLAVAARRQSTTALATLSNDARRALVEGGALPFQLAVSMASVLLLVALFGCAGRAAGITLAVAPLIEVVPLVLAVTTIPWAFAGLGPREVATATLFSLLGLAREDGVATSVTFGVLSLLAAAPGVVILLLPGHGSKPS